ncbi:hypothetical protein ACFSJW_20110 [Flavobacterium artemisiae]|uniref:Uncharacterized protein n=1 Tax=Flavobacterium artemisiae TaxID=2126556 RepID=A0ABW4HBB8_9FLAO
MKYTILLLFVFMASFRTPDANVYICGTTGAKKYHLKENCRGLSSCRSEILKKSVRQAQGLGLTLCGWED